MAVQNDTYAGSIYSSVYRVTNLGSQVNAKVTDSAGVLYVAVAPNSSEDIAIKANERELRLSADPTTYGTNVLIEPLPSTIQAGYRRSPLSYVLKATDSLSPRLLTGGFFGVDGRELLSYTGNAVLTMAPTTAVQTLAQLYLTRTGNSANDLLWADCVEFRGVLSGGPAMVFPGTPTPNLNQGAEYTPVRSGLIINPGPVVLGGMDCVNQTKVSGGVYDAGTATSTLSVPINSGSTATITGVDATSCPLASFFLIFTPSAQPGSLRITAARRVESLGTSGSFTSSVFSVDESFTIASTSEQTVHIELDQGLWEIKITPSGVSLTGAKWIMQRFS